MKAHGPAFSTTYQTNLDSKFLFNGFPLKSVGSCSDPTDFNGKPLNRNRESRFVRYIIGKPGSCAFIWCLAQIPIHCQSKVIVERVPWPVAVGRSFSLVWTVRARTSRRCYTELGPPNPSKIMISPRAGELLGHRSTPTTAGTADTATDEIPQIAEKSVSRRLVGTALRPKSKHTVLKFSFSAFKRRIA